MQIERHIPIPADAALPGSAQRKYPFAEMGVGDSFAAPISDANRVATAAFGWKRRHAGWQFTGRRNGNEYRLWRTA